MYYEVCPIMFEDAPSEAFDSYAEAYKRAKELATKCENYDYVIIYKVNNNNKEQLVRVLTSY